VLFSAFFVSYLMATNSGSMGLGQGGALFETVMWIEFAMIYLVLPAAMAGAIAEERERRTLSLLYLSKIQPWGILLQKFASRLVPIMTIVSLGLPLLTISYSLGGVSDDMIWNAIYCLGLGSFQVGAIALWSSVFCHSTVTAVIVTYLLIGLALR
jgi:ABC-type transport system involved in multi-copper enzyme maturation permease subunit